MLRDVLGHADGRCGGLRWRHRPPSTRARWRGASWIQIEGGVPRGAGQCVEVADLLEESLLRVGLEAVRDVGDCQGGLQELLDDLLAEGRQEVLAVLQSLE